MNLLSAVLLAAAVGSWIPVPGGEWNPPEEMLAQIQSELPSFVKLQATKLKKALPEWSSYTFQYQGQTQDGRRFVFISGFCIEPPDYVEERFLLVLDGGTCFFNVKYDPEKREFFELGFHGEA